MSINQVYLLSEEGVKFPCVLLDKDVLCPPEDREVYVELGEGQEPIEARVWMTTSQRDALPTQVASGWEKSVSIVMKGDMGEEEDQELRFNDMYIVSDCIHRAGLDSSIHEIRLMSKQLEWKLTTGVFAANSTHGDMYVIPQLDGSYALDLSTLLSKLSYKLFSDSNRLGSFPDGVDIKWTPLNFSRYGTASHIIATLLGPVGYHLVYNPFASHDDGNTGAFNDAFSIVKLNYLAYDTDMTDVFELAKKYLYEGSSKLIGSLPPQLVPRYVEVESYRWRTTTGASPGGALITRSGETNLNPTGRGHGCQVVYFDWPDVGYRPTYHRDIPTMATELRDGFWGRINIPTDMIILIGGHKIVPNGVIRNVRWTMDYDGWFTEVSTHNHPIDPDLEQRNYQVPAGSSPRPNGTFDQPQQERVGSFTAIVLNHTSQGMEPSLVGRAWFYQIRQVIKTGRDYIDAWTTPQDDTLHLDDNNNVAYVGRNLKEVPPSHSELLSTGINIENLPDGFVPQPVPNGSIVRCWLEYVPGDTPTQKPHVEFWFEAATGPDGSCEE